MASTCDVYKHNVKIGSGSVSADSASLTGFSAAAHTPPILRRNVQVQITQSGIHTGRTFNTQIVADNGAGTLTMRHKCPFVGA